ncbi:MAG: hypothetical protein K6F14_01770 [Clostridiales bacterium]|nr:hypothetical protein [Clostridiales bacterium]
MNRRTVYKKEALNEISFPMGGIGTGSIGLGGNGALVDWEIYNRPNKGTYNGFSHFAIKAVRNHKHLDARVLIGDYNKDLAGATGRRYGAGLRSASMQGFPHFKNCVFHGEFPIARVDLSDDSFPGRVTIRGWNPLIPLDEDNSSIPCAFIEISVKNTSDSPLDYYICSTLRNPTHSSVNTFKKAEEGSFIHFTQTEFDKDSLDYLEMALGTDSKDVSYQEYWYRGSWNDGLERYWRNFTESEKLIPRHYNESGKNDFASLSVHVKADPGKTCRCRFVISWHMPNCCNYWKRYTENDKDVTWKNYYAVLFKDSMDSACYSLRNWDNLYKKTKAYKDAIFSSSLPVEVTEALASAVSVLKSPTVMRLENGEFYGWEGVWEESGSCEGTCTHVWNYAYALCFLFPRLERGIRETDFTYNQNSAGGMCFRMQLPLGRDIGTFRPCVDGQMGGVIKTYREWKLSGNDEWLKKWWPKVKLSLEYAWSKENRDKWDLNADGVLEGRQHHTLDMELFGPSSWLEGFYLGALKAGREMAIAMGDKKAAEKYSELFSKGKAFTDEKLFNGKWYSQDIDLSDKSILEPFEDAEKTYWNSESGEIKYQIGKGCEIDQCLAQWHANICGLGEIFDKEKLHTALKNVYKNNYKKDMRSHYNTFRLFAVNDESGAVICTFPKGTKAPAIPIPYAQESMHGFEYALAGLLVSEGMITEGINIVKSVRDRYRGYNRNPFNEIECGSNYARSMASFALLPIFSGFSFDMTKNRLGFNPVIKGDFNCPWFVSDAWGVFEKKSGTTSLSVKDGEIHLKDIELPYIRKVRSVTCDKKAIPFTFEKGMLSLDATVSDRLVIECV